MKYTSEQIKQINNSIPIVKYASQYLNLQQGSGKRSNEYWTPCPFHEGDINPSLSFNNDKNVYKCMGCDRKGYLINFVMEYHKLNFIEAIEHILQLVNINFQEKEYSEIMEYLYKNDTKKKTKNIPDRIYLLEDIINKYAKEPIKEWINAGISLDILNKYNVRYDKNRNTIVFPIRDLNGNIISIKARTLYENHKDLGIPKYTYYTPIGTNDFLFGLYENRNNIIAKNEIIVLEGAKGVMLAETYGYNNCVSLETNNINELQMNLLLELKVNVVMCLDKGIRIVTKKDTKTKDLSQISIGLLPKFTNVYVMEDKDKDSLLKNKDCLADKGKEIFDKLYNYKYKL